MLTNLLMLYLIAMVFNLLFSEPLQKCYMQFTCILHVAYMQLPIMTAICVQFNSTGLHANCSHFVHMSTNLVTNSLLYCMQTV